MFYFRLNKLKVIDNRTERFFFKRDLADVKLLSLVTTGNHDLSNLDKWMQESDQEKKIEILRDVVSSVIASRILTEVKDVKDNQSLFFGDTGYVLYQSDKIPQSFNWCFTAVKSKRNVQEIGDLLTQVKDDSEFPKFASVLGELVANLANPAMVASIEVSKFTIGTIAKILKNKQDEQLGILYMSLNRYEHYLHGERKKDDVLDLTGNLRVDYSLFGFELGASV